MSVALDRSYRELRDALWRETGGRCWYCGEDSLRRTIDHVIPRGTCGFDSEAESNLVPACGPCNGSKGTSTIEQFREAMQLRVAGWPYFSGYQLAWLRTQSWVKWPEPYVFFFERAGLVRGNRASIPSDHPSDLLPTSELSGRSEASDHFPTSDGGGPSG